MGRHLGCAHGILFIVLAAAIVVIAAMFSGCTATKEVIVEKVRTDTTYITKHQRDSIWQHDSVYIHEKGDTVWVEKWHTKYRDILQIDTFREFVHDTIGRPYPYEVEVPAKLTWWQRTQMYAGDVLFLIIIGMVIYGYFKFTT